MPERWRTPDVPAGSVVAVIGTAGSTGVQLARWAGADVSGTGRSHSGQLATELGAGRYIALDTDRMEDAAGAADLVVDTIGGDVLASSAVLLRLGGTLVTRPGGRGVPARGGSHGVQR